MRDEPTRPACADHPPELFESGYAADHKAAKKICATCPAAEFAKCAAIAADILSNRSAIIEGTWAGKHYGGRSRASAGAL